MNELLEKIVAAIAVEVQKRLPQGKEVSAEELAAKLGEILPHAEWFRELMQEMVKENVSVEEVTNDAVEGALERVQRQFDITDYESDIKQMAEDVVGDYDHSGNIRDALDNYDFDDVVQHALDNFDFSDVVEQEVSGAVEDLESRMETLAEDVEKLKTERVAILPPEFEAIKQRVEKHDQFIKAMVQYALDDATKPEVKDGMG